MVFFDGSGQRQMDQIVNKKVKEKKERRNGQFIIKIMGNKWDRKFMDLFCYNARGKNISLRENSEKRHSTFISTLRTSDKMHKSNRTCKHIFTIQ